MRPMALRASSVHFTMLAAVWRSFSHATKPISAFSITHVSVMPCAKMPQIKMKTKRDASEWWQQHAKVFPNVAVMARQYLGCPASSAAVERLFSKVGVAYAAKRKRGEASTLEDIMFTSVNLS